MFFTSLYIAQGDALGALINGHWLFKFYQFLPLPNAYLLLLHMICQGRILRYPSYKTSARFFLEFEPNHISFKSKCPFHQMLAPRPTLPNPPISWQVWPSHGVTNQDVGRPNIWNLFLNCPALTPRIFHCNAPKKWICQGQPSTLSDSSPHLTQPTHIMVGVT